MSEPMHDADDARLKRWAYGRARSPEERGRAEHAAAELDRRAAVARELAERAAAERAACLARADGAGDTSSDEHPEPPLTEGERHRRRMLATGIAGVTAAALALGAGAVVLTQPNPDPLAIFESAPTDLDRQWAEWISENLPVPASLATRVLELDDDVLAIALRLPAVPGGRSTEWDPYCIFVTDSREPAVAALAAGNCALPERLVSEGVTAPIGVGITEPGFDAVVWGPVGAPRVERNAQLDLETLYSTGRVVDSLVFAGFAPSDALDFVAEPDRLLLGPAPLGTSSTGGGEVTAYGYVLRADASGTGETICLLVVASDGTSATACDPLSRVQEVGLALEFTADARSVTIRLDADGAGSGLSWSSLD